MARTLLWTLIVGLGATACMDLWSLARRRLVGTPLPDYALVGRWFAHAVRGRLRHESIRVAAAVRGERVIGWTVHYLVGVAFAGLLVACCGVEWLQRPTFAPALAVGIATVAAPMLILQPGMGAGIAARRTARPNAVRLQSVVTHAVFGAGLYVAGCVARVVVGS